MIGYFIRLAEYVANQDYLDHSIDEELRYLPFPHNPDPIELDRIWNVCLYYVKGGKQKSNDYSVIMDIDPENPSTSKSWLQQNIALNYAINWGWTNGEIVIGNILFIIGGLLGAALGILAATPNYFISGEYVLSALLLGMIEGASAGAEYFDIIGKLLGIVIGASIGLSVGIICSTLIGLTTIIVAAIQAAKYLYNPVYNKQETVNHNINANCYENDENNCADRSKYLQNTTKFIIHTPLSQTSSQNILADFDNQVSKDQMNDDNLAQSKYTDLTVIRAN